MTTNAFEAHGQTITRRIVSGRSAVQLLAGAIGGVFLFVGLLGFVPGVVSNFHDLSFAGHDSGAELLGLFQVSVLHNLVHLLFGVVGLSLAARGERAATLFLFVGGLVYLVLAIYGGAIDHDASAVNFVPVNEADSYLHLGLGVVMILTGVFATHGREYGQLD